MPFLVVFFSCLSHCFCNSFFIESGNLFLVVSRFLDKMFFKHIKDMVTIIPHRKFLLIVAVRARDVSLHDD